MSKAKMAIDCWSWGRGGSRAASEEVSQSFRVRCGCLWGAERASPYTMQPARKKDAPRIARPAVRYWKGKAPKGVVEVHESDSDSDNPPQDAEPIDVPITGVEDDGEDEEADKEDIVPQMKVQKSMNVALRNVDISKEGRVIVDGREESGRTIVEQGVLLGIIIHPPY